MTRKSMGFTGGYFSCNPCKWSSYGFLNLSGHCILAGGLDQKEMLQFTISGYRQILKCRDSEPYSRRFWGVGDLPLKQARGRIHTASIKKKVSLFLHFRVPNEMFAEPKVRWGFNKKMCQCLDHYFPKFHGYPTISYYLSFDPPAKLTCMCSKKWGAISDFQKDNMSFLSSNLVHFQGHIFSQFSVMFPTTKKNIPSIPSM